MKGEAFVFEPSTVVQTGATEVEYCQCGCPVVKGYLDKHDERVHLTAAVDRPAQKWEREWR